MNFRNVVTIMSSVAIACVLSTGRAAYAQLSLRFAPLSQNLNPSGSITFLGTLSLDTTSAESVSLTGASGSIVGPSSAVALDDSAFLASLPISLDPGTSYSGMFTVTATAATPGNYSLNYEVDGVGDSTSSSFVANGGASIDVKSAPVPEASSLRQMALAALLVLPGVFLVKRRRNASSLA